MVDTPQINPLHEPVVTATYHAPEGESKVVEWQGVTFLDGVATEVTDPDLGRKIKGNKLFTFTTTETPPAALAAASSRQAHDPGRDEHGKDDHGRDEHNKRR